MRSIVLTFGLFLAVGLLLAAPGVRRHALPSDHAGPSPGEPALHLGSAAPAARASLVRPVPTWSVSARPLLSARRWQEALDALGAEARDGAAEGARAQEALTRVVTLRAGTTDALGAPDPAGAAPAASQEPLVGMAALEAGRALVAAGQVARAPAWFAIAAASLPAALAEGARLDWAHALLDLGRHAGAAEVALPLLESQPVAVDSARLIWLRARLARAEARAPEAEALELVLWRDWPGSPEGLALAATPAWKGRAAQFVSAGRLADVLARVTAQVAARRPHAALADLEAVPESRLPRAERDRVEFLRGMAFKDAGQAAKARKHLSRVGASDPERHAQAALAAAQASHSLGRRQDRKDFLRAAASGVACAARDRAAFELADLEVAADHEDAAREAWARVAHDGIDASARARATWRMAWSCRKGGRVDEAMALFDESATVHPRARETAAALYWSARELRDRGQSAEAEARLRRVREDFPNDYHGVIASQELGLPPAYIPELDAADVSRVLSAALARLAQVDAGMVRWIAEAESLGLTDDALAGINSLAGRAAGTGVVGTAGTEIQDAAWQARVATLGRVGRHDDALRAFRAAVPDWRLRRDIPAGVWASAYPLDFESLVLSSSSASGLDPTLVFALIHQESVFRPAAKSWVGARGLMQIMPGTGSTIARWLKEPLRPDLLDPDLNVRYGTTYLRRLLDEFGEPEFALAGYNAGGGRVRQWRRKLGEDDMPLFVESIPFDETRDYVKSIAWNRVLYGARSPAGGTAAP